MLKYIFPVTFMLFSVEVTDCQSNPNIESSLDSLFRWEFSPNEPGGSILIKKANQTVFMKSYGVEDLGTRKKITEHTVFNTGSISKTFVAYGIIILQERRLLSIDDDLSLYFDDFRNEELAKKIKIKHLLSHTSGLPDLRNVSENKELYLTAKDEENFYPSKQAKELNFGPGERFQYSNPAFNGLALVIEKVANQPWQQFIIENIFKPAGMQNSKITDGAYPQDGVAHAYELKNGKYVESDHGEFPTFAAAGNGGVWCSVMDLSKYEKAIRNYTLLNKKWIDISRTVFMPDNWSSSPDPFVGLSWFLGEESLFEGRKDFGVVMIYHTGSQGGFRAVHLVIPEKDILLIGLFNRPPENFKDLLQKCLAIVKQYNWLE